METVQISIADASYGKALEELLLRDGECIVRSVDVPDPWVEGVLVVDSAAFQRLPSELPYPERVVLITQNDPEHLSRAWEAGVISVVFERDPINTAMLAIMAARLRCLESKKCPAVRVRPSAQNRESDGKPAKKTSGDPLEVV
ncbi:MAG: hypothetical protein ABFD60_01020 [Bryobacteraceae bacterium]